MSLLAQTAFVGAAHYESGTAVFYAASKKSWFAVATGIPSDPRTELNQYSWVGHFDRVGWTTAVNRDPNPGHPGARTLHLEIVLVTPNKLMAYWVAEQAAEWRRQVYGWRPAATPPPIPEAP